MKALLVLILLSDLTASTAAYMSVFVPTVCGTCELLAESKKVTKRG